MLNLQIINASTRSGRSGHLVSEWFFEFARRHGNFDIQLIDLAEVGLPLFDEPRHPRLGQYEHAHTKAWSAIVEQADAYVFVTPEYDHAPPASLINALQYLVHEWAYKPVGFVSYGGVSGGTRSVQMTKPIVTALKMMPIPEAVHIPFVTKSIQDGRFNAGDVQEQAARTMLDELLRWTNAMRVLRS